MERLRQQDFRMVLEFFEESYAIRDLEGFPRRVIAGLPKVVPCEITTYNEVDTSKRRVRWAMEPPGELDFAECTRLFEPHIAEHPLVSHYQRTQDGRALKISDFCSRNQFHRTGLYHEFYRRVRVEHQMACMLPAPLPLVIGIALNRGRHDFSERDRLLLNLVRPHLVQAYRNAEVVTRIQAEARLFAGALEALDAGVIVLAPDGRVRLMTPAARDRLAAHFGRPAREAVRLPEALRRWVRHEVAQRGRVNGVPPAPAPLEVGRDGRRLQVRLLGNGADLLLVVEERLAAPEPGALERFGLTRREAEVLAWVTEGKTNAEIGTILGARPRTVAKHLERIYQKLGVETRTAAANLALTSHRGQ